MRGWLQRDVVSREHRKDRRANAAAAQRDEANATAARGTNLSNLRESKDLLLIKLKDLFQEGAQYNACYICVYLSV